MLVLTIAVGVGGNAAVFGWIRGSIAPHVPFAADGIVSIFGRNTHGAVSYEDYIALTARRDVFAWLGAVRQSEARVKTADRTYVMPIAAVSTEMADLLQLSLVDGIVISHRAWRAEFGGKADPGDPIRIDDQDTRVAAVAPEWLQGLYIGRDIDIWAPLDGPVVQGNHQTGRLVWVIGRLVPGISREQAQLAANAKPDGADEILVRPYTGVTPDRANGLSRIGSLPSSEVRIEPAHAPQRTAVLNVAVLTPRSLDSIVLPPRAGRMFGGVDTAETCRVVIVNEAAAEGLFAGDAVGRSIEDATGEQAEIIGVVSTRQGRATTTPPPPTVYYYGEQAGTRHDQRSPSIFRVPVTTQLPVAQLATNVVSAGYFDAIGASSAGGSGLSDNDVGRPFQGRRAPGGPCRVGVINQEAAELFGDGAIGGGIVDSAGVRTQIVGVVSVPLLRMAERTHGAAIYFPIEQDFRPRMTLMLGAQRDPASLLDAVRERLHALPGGHPGGPVVTTLDTHLSRTALASERIAAVLLGACAAAGLAISVFGLYAGISESTQQRRRDIALRLALGASGWRVIRHLLVDSVRLAGAGALAGALGAGLVARWHAGLMPSGDAVSMWVWLVAPISLLVMVAIAAVVPMRRALAVDPLALISERGTPS